MNQLKRAWGSVRDLAATTWWILLVVGAGFVLAYQFVEPAPPRQLVISTGGESGAYYQFAQRYAQILARQGIELSVRTSAGSLENLARLKAGEAEVAFVQGGVLPPGDPETSENDGLLSLGSVFYEPVWLFYRGARHIEKLSDLDGRRIAIGQEGSGVRQLAQTLLEANQIAPGQHLLPLSGLKAAEELQQGRIDAAFIIAAEKAPVVQVLLRSPGVRVMSFMQAEAYQRRFPFLNKLVLPQGVVDLVRDVPERDIQLLAPTANLIVRDDLHPALQTLLLQAAAEVHGAGGFFQRAGEFPADKDNQIPLSDVASRYYKSGAPFLQRYLPFWLAVLIDRMIVLLVPFFALLLPLLRLAPTLYNWRVRSKVFRIYGELKFLEEDVRHRFEAPRLAEYRQRLASIDEAASQLQVPLSFSDLVYTLREHIILVAHIIDRREADLPVGGGLI